MEAAGRGGLVKVHEARRRVAVEGVVVVLGLRQALCVMKGKSKKRVQVQKGLFERRKVEKQ